MLLWRHLVLQAQSPCMGVWTSQSPVSSFWIKRSCHSFDWSILIPGIKSGHMSGLIEFQYVHQLESVGKALSQCCWRNQIKYEPLPTLYLVHGSTEWMFIYLYFIFCMQYWSLYSYDTYFLPSSPPPSPHCFLSFLVQYAFFCCCCLDFQGCLRSG